MSDVAIRVENLGKRYRIGALKERHDTLRDAITARVSAPARRVAALFQRPSPNGDDIPPSSFILPPSPHIWALRDVSFEVKRGEVVGIIGRNGAGKSTLLKILSRITKPTTGRVELYGRVGSLLEVGTGFHPELSGRENVYLNGAILGMRKAEIDRKLDEIVAFAEIEKFLDTPVKRYSSGMYMRLAFAVAAHLEPEILLVDEVLAVGDAAFQKKCLGKMGDVARKGRTVLFVSHNMGAIKSLCPLAILLQGGRISNVGETASTVQSYMQSHIGLKSDVSLADDRLHRGGTDFRVTRVSIRDANSIPSMQIPFGQAFQVLLEMHLRRNVAGLHVGIGVATPDGTRLFTTHHSDTIQLTHFHAGRHVFRCKFEPNMLTPGLYYLHVGAHSEDSLISDYVPEALAFEILPITLEGDRNFKSRNFGLFMHPSQWQVEGENSFEETQNFG